MFFGRKKGNHSCAKYMYWCIGVIQSMCEIPGAGNSTRGSDNICLFLNALPTLVFFFTYILT